MSGKTWVYWVSYKRPNQDGLVWFKTDSQDVMGSSRQAKELAAARGVLERGYREYGISRTNLD